MINLMTEYTNKDVTWSLVVIIDKVTNIFEFWI